MPKKLIYFGDLRENVRILISRLYRIMGFFLMSRSDASDARLDWHEQAPSPVSLVRLHEWKQSQIPETLDTSDFHKIENDQQLNTF